MEQHTNLNDGTVCLRALEPEDLEVIYEIENDPDGWEHSNTSAPFSRYVVKRYIESTVGDVYAERELRLMAVRLSDGQPVGCADLTDISLSHGRAEVGMTIRAGERGQGYGTRTLELLCRYAFGALHLHQLYAFVAADNEASLQLFSRCGFVRRARLTDWIRSSSSVEADSYKDVWVLQRLREVQ